MRLSGLLAGLFYAYTASSEESGIPREPEPLEKPDPKARIRYIVQLREASVIEHQNGRGTNRKLDVTSDSVKSYGEYLESQQDETIATIGGQKMYSYKFSFNGFSAVMTAKEARALSGQTNVVRVWEDQEHGVLTDGSHEFIGLAGSGEPWSLGYTGEDVVVGVIDTGIHPEHPSFADSATPINGNTGDMTPYGPIPAGFNASGCDFGNQEFNVDDAFFECNNKLIKAACYAAGFSRVVNASLPCGGDGAGLASDEFLSARDASDHGSHVASIAVGNYGVEATLQGEVVGNITGMAPRARVAVYKACWIDVFGNRGTCRSSDVLAAIDQAVADGVDVLNLSLGMGLSNFDSPGDLALLRAADAGIYIAVAAGNQGPTAGTLYSPGFLPWVTAVGASTDDGVAGPAELVISAPTNISGSYEAREANSPVQLERLGGIISGEIVPAVPLDACSPVQNNLTDKIALVVRGNCQFNEKFNNVTVAGAKFIVVFNDGGGPDRQEPMTMSAQGTTLPGIMISYNDGRLLNETAGIETVLGAGKGTTLENVIAEFSSRGPNVVTPDLIKPDVVAPGVQILAAGSPYSAGKPDDQETFHEFPGTSMASPHVAGIFALLKQAHPEWSPAIARSAIMTTARQDLIKDFDGNAADPFDMGSGHIVPQNAFDPGLAFDVGLPEYEALLCGLNNAIPPTRCDELASSGAPFDGSQLNYPSVASGKLTGRQTITRTVTNVANTTGEETFTVSVEAPPGFNVTVNPSTMSLLPGATASYELTIAATAAVELEKWSFGSMTWSNAGGLRKNVTYSVRSPIAVKPKYFYFPPSVFGFGTIVLGSGPRGSLDFDIGFGYSGTYAAAKYGLVTPMLQQGSVEQDPTPSPRYSFPNGQGIQRFTFSFARDTILARFALFDEFTDGEDDLDMFVWACPETATTLDSQICARAGSSGNPTSNEQVDIRYPREDGPGIYGTRYIVDVHGFRLQSGTSTNFTLFHWEMGINDVYENMVVDAPTEAVPGPATITVTWPGTSQLDASTTYLGAVTHTGPAGVIGVTTVEIKT